MSSSRYTIVSWILIQENENKPKNMRKKKQEERERDDCIHKYRNERTSSFEAYKEKKKLCHSLHEHKQIINDPVFFNDEHLNLSFALNFYCF